MSLPMYPGLSGSKQTTYLDTRDGNLCPLLITVWKHENARLS